MGAMIADFGVVRVFACYELPSAGIGKPRADFIDERISVHLVMKEGYRLCQRILVHTES